MNVDNRVDQLKNGERAPVQPLVGGISEPASDQNIIHGTVWELRSSVPAWRHRLCCASLWTAWSLAEKWDQKMMFNPLQKVKCLFFQGQNKTTSIVELMEPVEADSTVSRIPELGCALHHLLL
jgi:hypothetical protein